MLLRFPLLTSLQLGSVSFNKYVDLFPGDLKSRAPPASGVVSGLAAVTMTLPFLGTEGLGDVGSKAAVDNKDKSIMNLHYTSVQSCGEVPGEGDEDREGRKEKEVAVLEEWDEFLT